MVCVTHVVTKPRTCDAVDARPDAEDECRLCRRSPEATQQLDEDDTTGLEEADEDAKVHEAT